MRVFLTGFMGAGKTVVGRELAWLLDVPFVDLDRTVEEAEGCSVAEIFAERGEDVFRELEHRALAATERHPDVVVATGGGVPVFERNRELMARLGTTVWIRPEIDTVLARLGAADATRPLYGDAEGARRLWDERMPYYATADLVVAVETTATPGDVAATILSLFRKVRCDI